MTLRPNAANSQVRSRQVLGLFAIFGLLFVAFLVAPIYRHHPFVAALLVLVAIGLCGLYFVRRSLYLRHATLFVDELRAGFTTALGRSKAVDRSAIGSVYLSRQVAISNYGATTVHRRMFIVGTDGHPLLRFDGTYWSTDDMQSFAATLGVPLHGSWMFDQTGDDLRRRLPGAISWWAAHPNIFWVFVLTPSIAAFIVLMVALNS